MVDVEDRIDRIGMNIIRTKAANPPRLLEERYDEQETSYWCNRTSIDEHRDFDVLCRRVHQLRDWQILAFVQMDSDTRHVRGHGQAQYRQMQLQRRQRYAPFRVPHDYALIVGSGQGHRSIAAQFDACHVA